MKNILVTGGAGFIGSNLIRYIQKMEPETNIYCMDNLLSGNKENLPKGVHFVQHDVNDEFIYFFKNLSEIYHLACPASPPIYQQNPLHTIKTCVNGTMNILEIARKHSSKILLTSTSEIYGDPLEHPQKEIYRGNVNCYGPRACYDEGKRMAETLFYEYSRLYNLDTRIVRIFNTYGPYLNPYDGRVVSNFIRQALQDEPITIYGDGTQTRSLCYIDDLVEGIYKTMKQSAYTDPINLGNPSEHTITEIAEKILKITGSSSPIIYFPLPKDDPCKRKPDISLAKLVIKWEPKVSVDEGLLRTIDYFKNSIPTKK